MRILVTGNLGYVGSLLGPLLVSRGHQVHGLDADLYRACDFGPPAPRVPTRVKDIRDIERVDLEGMDAVIHLAGLSNDPLGDLDPALTEAINYAATVRLAELTRAAGISRLVFASSCSIYGAAAEQWVNEDSPSRPLTHYARSKLAAERDLLSLTDACFLPICLRAGTVYGLTSRIRFDLVLNNLVAWAQCTGRVRLKSDGRAWRPLLHVADMAAAFAAAVEAPRAALDGQVLNLGRTSDNVRALELARMVARDVPGSRLELAEDAGCDPRSYRVSCDALTRALPGLRFEWEIPAGIRQLIEGYRRVGLAADDFEGPRYQRIAHLRHLLARGMLDGELRWRAPRHADPAEVA